MDNKFDRDKSSGHAAYNLPERGGVESDNVFHIKTKFTKSRADLATSYTCLCDRLQVLSSSADQSCRLPDMLALDHMT